MTAARHVQRTDLAAAPAGGARGEIVASLSHLSDLHVLDSASPMRFEWIELLAHDPRWQPLLHMHRPQEALVPHAVAAHLADLRADPVGATLGCAVDLVLSTGDNIDNAQRNELDAYLALFAGGVVELDPRGGPLDATGSDGPAGPWPYWCPEPDVADAWNALGYPSVPGLLDQLAQSFVAPGVGLPWTSLPGNHDLMCQGTAFVTPGLAEVAVGGTKALFPPHGFVPDDPLTLFVDAPDRFLGAGGRPVPAVEARRSVDLAEWVAAHATAGAEGYGPAPVPGAGSAADRVVERDGFALVLLDTNHPAGDYQGSIGEAQLAWLDDVLARCDADGTLVVLASHHGSAALVNTRPGDDSRRLAAPLLELLHRHPSVIAWLVGHRHCNRIRPHAGPNGGFWEITTASVIDWPVERRSVELIRHGDGTVEIVTTMQTAAVEPGGIAALHRSLARWFDSAELREIRAGRPTDRDTRLFVAR